MPNLPVFVSYVVVCCYTPGPNNIMAMTNAAKNGFRKGMRFCWGMLIGSFLLMVCCAVFTTALFRYIPVIQPFMEYGGAIYILWLAWVVFQDKPHEQKQHRLEINSIFTGLVMQFVNPKAYLYAITAYSSFLLPYVHSYGILFLYILFLTIMGFAGVCSWALFGSVFQKFFEKHRKGMNLIMALLLAYCAYSMIA